MMRRRQMMCALVAAVVGAALPGAAAGADEDRNVGESADDIALATQVKAALVAADAEKARRLEVIARSGVVELTGSADTREDADAAVGTARSQSGVRSVIDSIQVGRTR